MRIRYRSFLSLLFVITMLLLFSHKYGVTKTTKIQQAKELSRQVQTLVEQKKWEKAMKLLKDGLERYKDDEQAKEIRSILNFSFGFLYQRMSDDEYPNKIPHLKKAAEYYKKALNGLPKNVQIMKNLAIVYKQLEYWSEAENMLKSAMELDKENLDVYYIAIGDLYRERDLPSDALDWYKKASKSDPSNEMAHWRIINIYKKLPDTHLTELFDHSKWLKDNNFLKLAKEGFGQVINRSFNRDTPLKVLAERALLQWAELGATQGWISEESLQFLPDKEEWNTQAIRELWGLVTTPEITGKNLVWWRKSFSHRHVAASIMKIIADDLKAKGEIVRALHVYNVAFFQVAPRLGEKPDIAALIVLELSSLYHNYPDLDPLGKEFELLERSLFDLKGDAYRSNDLAAIQRLHTVLGLIYAEKEQWDHGDWHADNAIFQLKHALEVAQKRYHRDPNTYQPLPHLESLLAEGYKKVGNHGKAAETYLDAAEGYLDLDSLDNVKEMLDIAVSYSGTYNSQQKQKLNELINVYETRKKIPQLHIIDINPKSDSFIGKSKEFKWLFKPAHLRLDNPFVNRQRFKAFVDLGNRAKQLEASPEDLLFHTDALEIIKGESTLSGMDDIVRLEQIKNTVLKKIRLKKTEQIIGTGHYLDKNSMYKKGKTWWLASPSQDYSIQVGIGADFLLAGDIGNRISRDPILASEPILLYVEEGDVTILQELSTLEMISRADEVISSIEGVKQVKTKGVKQEETKKIEPSGYADKIINTEALNQKQFTSGQICRFIPSSVMKSEYEWGLGFFLDVEQYYLSPNFSIAYSFGYWKTEKKDKIEFVNPELDNSIEVYSLSANIIFKLLSQDKVSPYIGAGPGLYIANKKESEEIDTEEGEVEVNSVLKATLGFQIIAGIKYSIFDLTIRYLNIKISEWKEKNVGGFIIGIGFLLRF